MFNSNQIALAVSLILALLVLAPTISSAATNHEKRKKHVSSKSLTSDEVKEAEQRLSDLGYRAGTADGVVDNATRNALLLFQKWERRKLTGRLSRSEFEAIMNASGPAAKDSGYKHVEVNLDRQLLVLTDDEGALKKLLPVSTGSNKRYKAKGMRGLAYTPRGRFRIYAKLSGWRKSALGLLYYPNYFSDGLAIHGNPSVPRTPQSHGCIRIPMSAAAAISRELPVGTIVLIYDKQSFVSAKDWAAEDKRKLEAINR